MKKEASIYSRHQCFFHLIAVTLTPQWGRKESFLLISDPQRSLGTKVPSKSVRVKLLALDLDQASTNIYDILILL